MAAGRRDYRILSPSDRLIRAACEDVLCAQWQFGWETTVDESAQLGQAQAAYIRSQSGRTFTEHRSGALTVFRFAPRQRCFADHQTRPQRLLVVSGGVHEHTRATDFIEDAAEHLDRLTASADRG